VTRYHVAAYTLVAGFQHLLFDSHGQLWYYSLDTGRRFSSIVSGRERRPKFSPDGKRLAYVRKHNLYVHPVSGEEGDVHSRARKKTRQR